MGGTDRPIGYWLKHLHNLIEAQFDATLTDLGLGRRHWQILNLLSGAAQTRAQIEQALAPFWQAPAPALDAILDGREGLVTRGWVAYKAHGAAGAAGDALALTEQGRTAYSGVAARVGETRGRLVRGLTAEQYAETVRILSVMAGNLETALAEREASLGQPDPVAG